MSLAATSVVSFAGAAVVAQGAAPVAIRLARRTDFFDHPRGYRRHSRPTPLLGGMAVLAAILAVSVLIVGAGGRLLVPLGCAVFLCVLGTIDDRIAVAPLVRVLAEASAGAALYVAGIHWNTELPAAGDLVLTMVSVVIAVNAFNLMDNLDGACSTVAGVAGIGIGALAAIRGQTALAGVSFALSGACAGFLPWNLARPAKAFLGDGGSMPLGLLIGSFAILAARPAKTGAGGLLVGALLAGLPVFDTALVSVSRTRRGVRLVTGGRDHLSHRLLLVALDPRRVAIALAALQGLLSTLAIAGYELGADAVDLFALGTFLAAVAGIIALDTPRWRPPGIAVGPHRSVPASDGLSTTATDAEAA